MHRAGAFCTRAIRYKIHHRQKVCVLCTCIESIIIPLCAVVCIVARALNLAQQSHSLACFAVFLQNWQSKLQSTELFEDPEIVYKVGIADGGRGQFWFGHQCLCSWPSLAFFLDALRHERCWRCGMQWSCGCLCQGACGNGDLPFGRSETVRLFIDSYREARQWRWAMTLCQNCDALGRSFALEAWTCKCWAMAEISKCHSWTVEPLRLVQPGAIPFLQAF